LTLELGTSSRELLGADLEHRQLRREEDGENQQDVGDDGEDDAFSTRDGASDNQLVLVATVDVEVNQSFENYNIRIAMTYEQTRAV
jgi:hypothetical protein